MLSPFSFVDFTAFFVINMKYNGNRTERRDFFNGIK